MTQNPFLQHLIADPNFGYLFPHRLSLAAFGAANDYQLRKHYPRLVEGQHYLKIRGTDHVDRIFYTLAGLLALADLVNTPQAQAFKHALIQHTQPSAIVAASPTAIAPAPPTSLPTLQRSPALPMELTYPFTQSQPQEQEGLNADPAYLLAQYLQPQIEQAIHQTVAAHTNVSQSPPSPSPAPPTPQDTAALIFEAQKLVSHHSQVTAQNILAAQQFIAERPPNDMNVNISVLKQWDNWLSKQDTWAMSLIAAGIVALAGISAYFFVSLATRPAPAPTYAPQTHW